MIKVMSFNIRNSKANDGEFGWPYRKNAAAAVLFEHAPDLLGVQEALIDQIKDLDDILLPHGYQRFSRGREADGSGEHSAIYVQTKTMSPVQHDFFWLSNTPDVPGSIHWDHHCVRMANYVVLEQPEMGSFIFMNTHLDHESALAREKGAELLVKKINALSVPAVLAGDMNTSPDSKPLQVFAAGGLENSIARYQPGQHTFHNFGRIEGQVIDFILCTNHWRTNRHQIVTTKPNGMYPSDHYPITMMVGLR